MVIRRRAIEVSESDRLKSSIAQRKASGKAVKKPSVKRKSIAELPWSDPAIRRSSDYWDFNRDGLSWSGMDKFATCREQFRLHYVEGWRKVAEDLPLTFGDAAHWFLAKFNVDVNGVAMSEKKIDELLKLYDAEWRRDNAVASPTAAETHEHVLALCSAIWKEYALWWPEDRAKKWKEVEDYWEMQYPVESPRTILKGYCDGAYYDDEGLWLYETKTKGNVDEWLIQDSLVVDTQTQLYMWRFWKQVGELPTGVQYNIVRRPAHRLKQNESLRSFVDRVRGEIRKDPEKYFLRITHHTSEEALQRFETEQLSQRVAEIEWWSKGGPHYINSTRLVDYGKRVDTFDVITKGDVSGLHRAETRKKEK